MSGDNWLDRTGYAAVPYWAVRRITHASGLQVYVALLGGSWDREQTRRRRGELVTRLAAATGRSKSTCYDAVAHLIEVGVLEVRGVDEHGEEHLFAPLDEPPSEILDGSSEISDDSSEISDGDYYSHNSRDSSPIDPSEQPSAAPTPPLPGLAEVDLMEEARTLCEHFADCIASDGSKRPNVTKTWVSDMEKLMRLDGRTPEDVRKVIDWLTVSNDQVAVFWQPNVRSPAKLRTRWDTMATQYRTQVQGKSHGKQTVQERMADNARLIEEVLGKDAER